MKKQKNPLYGR